MKSPRRWLRAAASEPAARKGFLAVVDQGMVSTCGFATSVIIGRAASQEQLGLYYLALSLILFARGLLETLTCVPYAIYCHRRHDDALATYTGSCLVHALAFSGLVVVAFLVLSEVLAAGVGPVALGPAAWVLLVAAPFLLLREFVRQVAFARLRVGVAIALDGVVVLLQLGALVTLALRGEISAATAYAVMGGACAVACLGWLLARVEPLRFERASFGADWSHNWPLARWAFAGQLVGSSAPYLMPWILAHFHGIASAGLLAAGIALVGIANIFVTGISNFLTPKAARAYAEEGSAGLRRVLWAAVLVFGTCLGAFALLALVAGGPVAALVYGETYREAGPVVTALALWMLLTAFAMTAGNGLYAVEQARANFFADVGSTAAALVAALLLIEPLGALGTALSMVVGASVSAVAKFALLWRLLEASEGPATGLPRATEP